jgi:hypothetical protein
MAPFTTGGVYLNFEQNADDARVRAGYEPGTYARLVELKDKWDPTNVFRVNQNIAPSATVPQPRDAKAAPMPASESTD